MLQSVPCDTVDDLHLFVCFCEVSDVAFDPDERRGVGYLFRTDENTTTGNTVGCDGVGDVYRGFARQPDITVEPSVGVEVEPFQRFGTRNGIVTVVKPDHEQIFFAGVQGVSQVDCERKIATQMAGDMPSVEPDFSFIHSPFECE